MSVPFVFLGTWIDSVGFFWFSCFCFSSNCTILGAWAQEIFLLAHLFFPVPRSAFLFWVWPTFSSSSGCIEMKCIQNRNFGNWTVMDLQLTCPCAASPVTMTCWCCRRCLDFSARIGSYFRQVDRLMRKSWWLKVATYQFLHRLFWRRLHSDIL